MNRQNNCPYCSAPASARCAHLALAVEGRHFVRGCVEASQAQKQWQALCDHRRDQRLGTAGWSSEQEDFTWLETAFASEFLHSLSWFGGMDYEWRTGPNPGQGGFWVLLWSKDPRQLWWQLREEFERQTLLPPAPPPLTAQANLFA